MRGTALRWVSCTGRYALGVSTRAPGRHPGISGRSDRPSPKPAFELSEPKLHAPVARPGIVARNALVDRLAAADAPPVIAVVAPPGYGKTTLLAQWAERRQPRAGWVSADDRDNDPAVLLTHIAVAVDRIEPIDPAVFRTLASSAPHRGTAPAGCPPSPRWASPFRSSSTTSRWSPTASAWTRSPQLALGLPAGSQLAVGSRDELPLPTARLRAQGGIVEIGVDDLAMGERGGAGAAPGRRASSSSIEDLRELVQRTEGWPVGLYLAALAMKAGSPHPEVGADVHRRRPVHGRLPALRDPRSGLAQRRCRS